MFAFEFIVCSVVLDEIAIVQLLLFFRVAYNIGRLFTIALLGNELI